MIFQIEKGTSANIVFSVICGSCYHHDGLWRKKRGLYGDGVCPRIAASKWGLFFSVFFSTEI
jgi:hypothetical protein